MATTSKVQFYLGTVIGTKDFGEDPLGLLDKDSQFHECIIDIPGVVEGVKAFPKRGEIDEPKVGDLVFVTSLDPVYGSYYLYEKLKENDYVGFRAHGKMIDITHDAITIGLFDESTQYKDEERPDCSQISHIILNADGTVDIHTAGNVTINNDTDINHNVKGNTTTNIDGDKSETIGGKVTTEVKSDITIKSNANIKIESDSNIEVNGKSSVKITTPDATITGGGKLTVKGTVAPQPTGPFCGIPVCPLTGAPHQGTVVSGT